MGAKEKTGGLLKEFKEFAVKGNVIDMAIGVVIGGAFGKVVTGVIDLIITPILDALPKMEGGGTGIAGALITFCGVLVEFILTALVLMAVIAAIAFIGGGRRSVSAIYNTED